MGWTSFLFPINWVWHMQTPVLQFCDISWIISLKIIFLHLLSPLFLGLHCIIWTYHLLCILSPPPPNFLSPFLFVLIVLVCFEISPTVFSNSSVEFISVVIVFNVQELFVLWMISPPLKIVFCPLLPECTVISLKFSSGPCLVRLLLSPPSVS